METIYQQRVRKRRCIHFLVGFIVRIPSFLKFSYSRLVARAKGATIDRSATIPVAVAKKFNHCVTIDSNVSIGYNVDFTSMLCPMHIGHHVIIGDNVSFILSTHDIDSSEWAHIQPSKGLEIEPYVWICPNSIILPNVRLIGYGAVIGAGSVVTKDIPPMTVVGGNPAIKIRDRKVVHSDICVEPFRGEDLLTYIKTYMTK